MFKFRSLIFAATLTGAAALALHPGRAWAQTAPAVIDVTMALPSANGAFWPAYIADAEGFYAKEGLNVHQNLMDPNVIVAAVIGGGADIAYADSTQLLFAIQKHADLLAVGLSTDRQPYYLMGGPTIKTVADLKGKKIGAVSAIDIYTFVIKVILTKAGLDPNKDVTFVIGGNQTRRLAAMTAGAIDGGLFSPPVDGHLRSEGFNSLAFTPDYFPNLTLSAQTVRGSWARQNGATVRRILRAEAASIRWLNDPANKAEAIKVLMARTGAKPAAAEEVYQYYVGKQVWQDACIHRPGLVNVVKIMRQMKELTSVTEADVPKFADRQWCPN